MTEDEAREWLLDTYGRAALGRLETFTELLLAESARQSLIARSTFDAVWSRHVADSAQLALFDDGDGLWLDVGSGGGLPGVVIAILRDRPVMMVEPRRKRTDFLTETCDRLGLSNASVVRANVQSVSVTAGVVSARAVSNLSDLFAWTRNVVSRETQFVLPRGENTVSDLELVQRAWQGEFHVKQSLTDPAAGIVVATRVRPL